jgi:tRNA G46 methylase TrmB
LWSELEIYKNTWNNKNIYWYFEKVNNEWQPYYYIFKNNKAYQIVESAKGKGDWTYLIPQQQAQIEVPPK